MATGKRPQSSKVGQTLQDLEAAFADWEALTEQPVAEKPVDDKLREKTKKLLSQLREQLAELGD